jgi:hypothetical protein
MGLPTVFDEDQFNRLMGRAFEDFRKQILALKPGASVLLEKTPAHTLHVSLICRVVPEARFVHLIRDPRGVVNSLLDAGGRSWGSNWAPRDPYGAALLWRQHVEAGLECAAAGPRCLEIRYERMVEDPEKAVASLLNFVDLQGSPAELLSVVEAQRGPATSELVVGGEAAKNSLPLVEPRGFDARSRVKRRHLTDFEEWVVDRTTGRLSTKLGYRRRHYGALRSVLFGAWLVSLRIRRQVTMMTHAIERRLFSWGGPRKAAPALPREDLGQDLQGGRR